MLKDAIFFKDKNSFLFICDLTTLPKSEKSHPYHFIISSADLKSDWNRKFLARAPLEHGLGQHISQQSLDINSFVRYYTMMGD